MNSVSSPVFSPLQEKLLGLTGSGRQAFLHSLSQHARLISIETPLDSDALIVESYAGREAMSELFRFDIDCLATSAHYELKAVIGEEVTLRLRMADGDTRSFHGIVTAASQLGGDGSLARYRLTLSPWLHALTLRRDSYVFQDKTVLDILEEVFKDYPIASYRFDVKAPLPKRSLTMQYRETDYDFIVRLIAEEGLNFFIRHDEDHIHSDPERERGTTSDGTKRHARHCFVVFDANETLTACSQAAVRIHRADATESEDSITLFSQCLQVMANAVALGCWDYKTLMAHASEDDSMLEAKDVPPLEFYEGSGAYRYSDAEECQRIARARAESLALQSQTAKGESSVRAFAVGTWFELMGETVGTQASQQTNEYIVLSIEHRGSNNLSAHQAGFLNRDRIEPGTYRNHFTCAPRTTPIRPTYWLPKPTAPGAQLALIVGIADEEITTERDHRVKVQFPWQRGERSAAGQLTHPAASNAPGNETAGTWVRVAEPAAGANWGAHFIPRVGQEVLIDFIAGDIDRPMVTGQLYNGEDPPPYHGADNHAGALTGIRSKEYAADGFNRWAIDDTPGQLRQSLASSYSASQLNIGYLIRQGDNVRGAYRGAGFELATDCWSTMRAKRGIFISTTQRARATSTQLDNQEAQDKLQTAAGLANTLSDAAAQHHALPLSTQDGIQQLRKIVGDTNNADDQDIPGFAQPVALLDSQAGVNAATPASAVTFAGQDITLTAASTMRMSAGQVASVTVAKTASLFTHAGGAKVIAAEEPVSMRAHTGPMDMLADKAITLTSSNGNIKIQAKQEILLASGGGYIKLAGSNIDIHCPSSVSVKGATHDFLGADSLSASSLDLPEGHVSLPPDTPISLVSPAPEHYSERLLVLNPITGESISTGYSLIQNCTVIDKGRTTDDGFSMRRIQDHCANFSALVGLRSPWTVEYHASTEAPPTIHDADQDIHSSEVDAQ